MTPLAQRAKSTGMRIVAGMAAETGARRKRHRQGIFRRGSLVACRAGYFKVRAIEWVISLTRVIKIPSLPASRVVACLALAAKRTFVNVIAVVTFGAVYRCILVRRRAVAGFALRSRMRPRKLEF
jgi:hypothetical protein